MHSLVQAERCLRCLLLVMCTHPFAKETLTLHLARSEGHEHYLGCNSMHRKVLASSHQHLMAEAPEGRVLAQDGIETPAILHFGSALTMRELCLRNSGSNSSRQTG